MTRQERMQVAAHLSASLGSRRASYFWLVFLALLLASVINSRSDTTPEAASRLGGPQGSSTDLLVLRNGQVQAGQLKACANDRCQLGTTSFLRSEITWIGFGAATAATPAIADPSIDEVHLRDGTVRSGRLVGISPGSVVTQKGSLDRANVTWVHLVAPPDTQNKQPISKGDEGKISDQQPSQQPPPPPAGPPPESKQPPAPAAPSVPRAPLPPNDAVKPCPTDKPLGGWIRADYVFHADPPYGCEASARSLVRFPLVENAPDSSPWWAQLWSGFSAPEISYDLSVSDCVDIPGDEKICQATGGRKTGTATLGARGPLGFRPRNGYLHFYPVRPEIAFESLPDETYDLVSLRGTCASKNSSGGIGGDLSVAHGNIGPAGGNDCSNPFVVCVQPTACQSGGNNYPSCMQQSDRYAVLPFSGNSTQTDPRPERSYFPKVEWQWEVCCGCGEPPKGGVEPINRATPVVDCSRLGGLFGKMQGLREAYQSHERDLKCATRKRDLWRDRIWGGGGSLQQFSGALLQLANTLQGALGEFLSRLDERIRAIGSLGALGTSIASGDLDLIQAAIDGISNPKVLGAAQKAVILVAKQNALAYLRDHPGDVAGAAQLFRQQLKAIKDTFEGVEAMAKGLAIAAAVYGYYDSADTLFQQLSNYFEWRREAENAQRDMDQVNNDMAAVQVEIDALRARCPDYPNPSLPPKKDVPEAPCPDVPSGSTALQNSEPAIRPAAFYPADDTEITLAQNSQPRIDSPALEKLKRIREISGKAKARYEDSVFPTLAPFIAHMTDGIDLRVLVNMLEGVLPDLEKLEAEAKEVSALGRDVETNVKASEPPPGRTAMR